MKTKATRTRLTRLLIGAGLAVALSWLSFGSVAANAAAPNTTPAKPQLSIAIDDGHSTTKAGDALTYSITVTNLGNSGVHGLAVSQTMPSGLTFRSADSGGVVAAGVVHWTVDLKASGKAVLHTAMTVTSTPKDLLRLAAVACASSSAKTAPIVCASHSDQLPAGAAAVTAAKQAAAKPSSSSSTSYTWWYVGGGVLLVLLVGFGLLRYRGSHRSVSTP